MCRGKDTKLLSGMDYLWGVRSKGTRALMFYILLLLELAIENILLLFLERETKKRVNYIFIQKND